MRRRDRGHIREITRSDHRLFEQAKGAITYVIAGGT
jgi:GDP-D-mannose dehydratase